MPELAAVVAVLNGPEPRCHTLQVVGREWRHHGLLHEAFMASVPPGAIVATTVRASRANQSPKTLSRHGDGARRRPTA